MSKQTDRPSIYMNPPLEEVRDSLPNGMSFAKRLGQICERYALICKRPPELTESERLLLANTLSGSYIEPLLIRHLDAEIEDSDAGDESELRDLAERVRGMSIAERVALVESLGF